ncbi:MAG TPA: methyltransferase domain-containing protein [Gemmataceae bacterium]|jgi:2-polyprenyl-3-methyl-5-hydroxy-6-metoxy-1,4-benzoquinol methylase|nr:methyltransferase domain-containing protein [Gemmataceae bacterium]
MRVALIFDNKARPETTGVYCRRAQGQLVEVEHFLPGELARIPREGFDLYLNIDDGLEYRLPADLRPSAWWAIDTHLNFDWCLKKVRDFDCVFAAQKDGAERLRAEGIASASWLPLACDPELHGKHHVDKECDVCFVGNVFPGPRADLLDLIRKRFPSTFVGQRYFEEMARTYSAARIVFNRSIKNDVNMRVFEALASGSLLVTNDIADNGQAERFQDGIHLATYRSADELLDKIAFYLARQEVRERIAAAGRQEVLARHTYRHRMERLFQEIESRLAERPRPVSAGASPPTPARKVFAKRPQPVGTACDPSYFEFSRPEVVALVPPSARRVLDIGCGAGRLGETLKARQAVEVWGIEAVPEAAQAARTRLDQVQVADVEQVDPAYVQSYFDTVICADVLEHLRDPARLLRHVHRWLAPGGQVVASIPNVRHHTVLRKLLEGNWTYEPAGLLDRTHLRFFTRREIEKLFYRAGFTVSEIQAVPGPGYDAWEQGGCRGEVKAGRLRIGGLDPADAEEFYVYQYLVRAVRAEPADFGLTSIVIVTHNELDYTRQCTESIRQYTDEPYELVFVDNSSTDGTQDYLRSLPGVKVLVNQENRGFPAAVNQGIEAAAGKQILLLNNDTLVTTGWLRYLLQALHSDPQIGLAGPCTNQVSGEQEVAVRYDDLGGLDGFAWDWSKGHAQQRVHTDRLVGLLPGHQRDSRLRGPAEPGGGVHRPGRPGGSRGGVAEGDGRGALISCGLARAGRGAPTAAEEARGTCTRRAAAGGPSAAVRGVSALGSGVGRPGRKGGGALPAPASGGGVPGRPGSEAGAVPVPVRAGQPRGGGGGAAPVGGARAGGRLGPSQPGDGLPTVGEVPGGGEGVPGIAAPPPGVTGDVRSPGLCAEGERPGRGSGVGVARGAAAGARQLGRAGGAAYGEAGR